MSWVNPWSAAPPPTARDIGAPAIIGKSGIPFIHLSSGSVAANGAISGITALPIAYPSAYCYFPANILATTIAAGWYYCTFSTTTAGTAFLNTYSSGQPLIPASPTAVTDGKGAFTGDTTERGGPTLSIAAGAMGPNGRLEILTSHQHTNNANSKVVRYRYSGLGGTAFAAITSTSQSNSSGSASINNRGSQAVQSAYVFGFNGTTGTGNGFVQGTENTAVATTFVISLSKVTATDNLVLEDYRVALYSDGT